MIILTNGCSHTRGACRNCYEDSYASIVTKSLIGTDYIQVTLREYSINSFTFTPIINLIKENPTKDIHILLADYGKSNELIFFETLNILYQLDKHNIKIDFSIIQWTGPNRRVHSLFDKIIKVNPYDNYEYGVKFEPWASATTLQYILTIQNELEKRNINYCFVPYMEVHSDHNIDFNLTEFLNLKRFTTHPFEGHRNDFRYRNLCCDVSGHPSLLGNYVLAGKVLDILGYPDSILGFYDYFNKTKLGMSPHLGLTDYVIDNKSIIQKLKGRLGDATKSELKKIGL